MALPPRCVLAADLPLSGVKNGQKIGKMLSTALKDVVASEANHLYQP